MSLRAALAGAATTCVVVAALGNPAVVEAAADADSALAASTLTAFPNWDVADAPGEIVGEVAIRLGATVVLAGLLGAVAGRSRSRAGAFLGGWAALVVAAAIAGGAGYVYRVPVVLDGQAGAPTYADGLVATVNAGAAFGLWTGWLVGLVLAAVVRPAPLARAPALPPLDPANASRRVAEPPPPWWAPTNAGDGAVRPGPTVFLPGGMHEAPPGGATVPPTAADGPVPTSSPAPMADDATYEMTTASGDPHPSDPDATQAIGLPTDDTRRLDAPDRDDRSDAT